MYDEPMDSGSVSVNIEWIKKSLAKIEKDMDGKYVTQAQFEPVKKVVYGIVSLVLIVVFGAVVGLVIISKR